MGIALAMTGWWMYIDVPKTPQAVVACVIIFNAAFGYRYVLLRISYACPLKCILLNSWGPLPWLYPPEVLQPPLIILSQNLTCPPDHAAHSARQGCLAVDCRKHRLLFFSSISEDADPLLWMLCCCFHSSTD